VKIQEADAKSLLVAQRLPVPAWSVAQSPAQARAAAERFLAAGAGKVVIKAQVLVGGRGKAGGVKLARNLEEAKDLAGKILGMDIKGETVQKVLVEQGIDIQREIYLGIIVDRARKEPVFMISAAGGVEIEEVAAKTPELILFLPVDPVVGLAGFQIRDMAYFVNIPKEGMKDFAGVVRGLYRAFADKDCSLAEINPLVFTGMGVVIGADAMINFDDNALEVHP
jgi:succinyl-CoA synthetase beta subunit